MIIDSHAHVYLPDFKDDLDDIVHRAMEVGVHKVFLPNIDSTTIDSMLHLETAYPGYFYPMMGLHPCSVKENYKNELLIVEQWLQKRMFAAVGEIGMDLYWDKSFRKQQLEVFEYQIDLALTYQLPVVIHSRESLDLNIQVISKYQNGNLRGVFHCFTGDLEQAARIADLGFYMGIGGVITFKNSGLADVVSSIPIKNIVIETDAPYLTPVPYRGKRNEPGYLPLVLQKIAECKCLEVQEVEIEIFRNTAQLFGVSTKI
jgi:TatD DNase family protein